MARRTVLTLGKARYRYGVTWKMVPERATPAQPAVSSLAQPLAAGWAVSWD